VRKPFNYKKFGKIFAVLLVFLTLWGAYGAGELYEHQSAKRDALIPKGTVTFSALMQNAEKHRAHGTLLFIGNNGATTAVFSGTLFKPAIKAKWTVTHYAPYVNQLMLKDLVKNGVTVMGGISFKTYSDLPSQHQMFVSSLAANLGGWFRLIIVLALPLAIIWFLLSSKSSLLSGRFRTISHETITRRFSDIVGLEGPKQELMEIADYIKDPAKYAKLGARPPRGVLLTGPPGNGKTKLAEALAGEAGVPFFTQSGGSFVELFGGSGSVAVRKLFEAARKTKRAIIFIDEIESLGRSRGLTSNDGAGQEHQNTLTNFLAEFDGLGNGDGIVIIGATNRPEILDPALLRTGRFDRKVQIPLPSQTDRSGIIEYYVKKVNHEGIDPLKLSHMSMGFSGSDLENWVNEAAIHAIRRESDTVEMRDFTESRDKILMGAVNKGLIMTDEERRITAYHEAGHAVVRLAVGGTVEKVTIQPRSQSLGATISMQEDKNLHSKQHILNELAVLCAGRAAEECFIGEISTGAANDLERASQMANMSVAKFGFGDHGVYVPQSQRAADRIENDAEKIVNTAYTTALGIVNQNKGAVEYVAHKLLDSGDFDMYNMTLESLPPMDS
jgi:cell division protease FtsH